MRCGRCAAAAPRLHRRGALERLAEMTAADGLHDEAAGAYRRLYDAVQEPAKRERRDGLRAGDARGRRSGPRVAPLAAEVAALPDAGAAAVREAQFALAEQLRRSGDTKGAMKIYRVLAGEVRSPEGAAAGYYTVKEVFDGGDMAKAEKAAFDYIDRATPHAGWLARAYLLLATSTPHAARRSRRVPPGRASPTATRPPTTELWTRRAAASPDSTDTTEEDEEIRIAYLPVPCCCPPRCGRRWKTRRGDQGLRAGSGTRPETVVRTEHDRHGRAAARHRLFDHSRRRWPRASTWSPYVPLR